MEDYKLIIAKTIDKIKIYQKTGKITSTNMLDPVEFAKVANVIKGVKHIAFGGYETAERKAIFIGVDSDIDFNEYLTLIRIEAQEKLEHRSVLGSILALGIKREMIGDIIINENECDVVVIKDIANFVIQNLERIGREKVKVSLRKIEEMLQLKDTSKTMLITVASPRIDAIISSCFGLSRELSVELVKRERVFLNHIEVSTASRQIKSEDIISVRGYGRVKVIEFQGETRKNRNKILVCKY